MRDVRFTLTGEPTFVALGPVAGGVEARGPVDLHVTGGPVIEAVPFLRSTAVGQFNRGNSRWVAQFGVFRTHATLEAAQDFLINHPGDLPTTANMLCSITLNNGALRYLTNPCIEIVDSSNRIGLTTLHRYRLSGGALVANNPNGSNG